MIPHILAGDLNFTLCPNEVWGSGRVADLLAGYFIDLFENSHLVDVVPHSLYPTWSNGRCGADYVGKLLDHFLMAEELCNLFGKYRSWSYAVGIFDHKAILLQLDFGIKPTSHPFKFNAGILKDPDFDSWFRETWEKLNLSHGAPSLAGFIHKIQWIKPLIQSWVKLKKSKDLLELEVIEEKIVQFHYRSDLYPLSIEQCSSLADLLAAKDRILLSIEEEWRQKSRATWLMAGDRNTKFFQRYANQRRLQNAIWEVRMPIIAWWWMKAPLKWLLRTILGGFILRMENMIYYTSLKRLKIFPFNSLRRMPERLIDRLLWRILRTFKNKIAVIKA